MRATSLVPALLLGAAACGGIAVLPSEDAADDSGSDASVASSSASESSTDAGPKGEVASGPAASSTGAVGSSAAEGGAGAGGNVASSVSTGAGGDACSAGPCVMAAGFVGVDIDLDGATVYATTGDDDTLVAIPKTGGATVVVAESDGYAGSLARYDDALFWAGDRSLFRVPATGGARATVATPGLPLGAIAIGGPDLYFVDRQAFGSIRAVPAEGGAVRIVVPYASFANDVAFVRGIKNWDTLLWASTDAVIGELHALVLDGSSSPVTLLGGMDTPGGIVAGSEGAYVTEPFAGIVSRVAPSGIGELLVGTVDLPLGITLDDTYLYITESGTSNAHSGRILRMGRFEATGIDVLAENLHSPRAIVADDDALYWLEGDPERSVMRLAKPAP